MSLDGVDDRLLLRRHVEGDGAAFDELYRRHKDRMWSVAVGVCGDPDLAADGVQEGFIAAFRRAESFRGDSAVTTWLHRIIVNACIDVLRRRRPTSELTDVVADRAQPTPDGAGGVDTRLALHDALLHLPEGQRLALVLVDMHGFPIAEAATLLEVAPGTIKSRCARGREALARALTLSGFVEMGTSTASASSDTTDHHEPKGGGHDG